MSPDTTTASTAAPGVAAATFPDLGGGEPPSAGATAGVERLGDVSLEVAVEIGRARLPVRDLLRLGRGSVIELDRSPGDPVDVLVNGTLFARGEIVVVGDDLGVRITEIAS